MQFLQFSKLYDRGLFLSAAALNCQTLRHMTANDTFFWQASAFARPGLAIIGVDFALRAVRISSRQISRLGERLAGGVAGRGFAQAALGFSFQTSLVQRLFLGRPVAVHFDLVQRVFAVAVRMVSLCRGFTGRKHPCSQRGVDSSVNELR